MNIQVLIYAYLFICAAMILFNIISAFVFQERGKRVEKVSFEFRVHIERQLNRIASGEFMEQAHKEELVKVLHKTGNMIAFDETMDLLVQKYPRESKTYFSEIHMVFLELTEYYHSKDPVTVAFFAHILGKYRILKGTSDGVLIRKLFQLLCSESLYIRENALYAIYGSGEYKNVVEALLCVDRCKLFHHTKLLTDRLLTFEGDRNRLAKALWRSFEAFSIKYQVVILEYIRFGDVDMREPMLELMRNNSRDDEIRYSCIRYFGKYFYEKAHPLLIEFLENTKQYRWEYSAIAARSLALYPKDRTVTALKRSLNNPNWHVRNNAAISLQRFNLPFTEYLDILEGNDRYAREIMQYRMQHEKLGKEAALT